MNRLYQATPFILQSLVWIPTRIFLTLFFHLRVYGLDNLKKINKNKGVIFAVNHSSEMDPILIPASLPFLFRLMPMFYVSRTADFYDTSGLLGKILYGGLFFKIWGAYPAYKTENRGDYDFSLKHHIHLLEQGKSICIFPEGQKTQDGNIQSGRPGVAFLSNKTGAVVVPVRIDGVFKITLRKFFTGKINVAVNFGKPLYRQDIFDDLHNIGVEEYKLGAEKIIQAIRGVKSFNREFF